MGLILSESLSACFQADEKRPWGFGISGWSGSSHLASPPADRWGRDTIAWSRTKWKYTGHIPLEGPAEALSLAALDCFVWAASHHKKMAAMTKDLQWTEQPWAQVLHQGCLDRVGAYCSGKGHHLDHGTAIKMA